MTAAQQAIKDAIAESERLQKSLKGGSQQVRSDNEKHVIQATAHAWFNNHRKPVVDVVTDDALKDVDDEYRALLMATGRGTLRTRYVTSLKLIKKALVHLQADHVIALSGAPAAALPVQSSLNTAPQFSLLGGDQSMHAILDRRWFECVACLDAKAPLAATVMMGGILESLLLARVNRLSDKSAIFTAATAPRQKDKVTVLRQKEWTLRHYIDVAHELKWISTPMKDISEVLRDYRNFIHPQKEYSYALQLSIEDAQMMWEVFKNIARQIVKP